MLDGAWKGAVARATLLCLVDPDAEHEADDGQRIVFAAWQGLGENAPDAASRPWAINGALLERVPGEDQQIAKGPGAPSTETTSCAS